MSLSKLKKAQELNLVLEDFVKENSLPEPRVALYFRHRRTGRLVKRARHAGERIKLKSTERDLTDDPASALSCTGDLTAEKYLRRMYVYSSFSGEKDLDKRVMYGGEKHFDLVKYATYTLPVE